MPLIWMVIFALASDDAWQKVREIPSGTEIRIFKTGARQPIMAKFDEADDERVSIATKTEQTAVAKADIERLDARPDKKGGRILKESRSTTGDPARENAGPPKAGPSSIGGPSASTSSGLTFSGKSDFETVYRRVTGAKP